ncbi:MAG: hypothetical protein ABII00_06230, partial [Elusimicrobiota bacterium]
MKRFHAFPHYLGLAACICLLGPLACKTAQIKEPPTARKEPKKLVKHGDERTDDYYWLKRRGSEEVLDYLNRENAYTEAATAHTRALRERLSREMKSRIKQEDASVPYKLDDHFYYHRYEKGKEYPIYCRKKGSLDAPASRTRKDRTATGACQWKMMKRGGRRQETESGSGT